MNSERFSQEINTLVSAGGTRTTAQISDQNPENDAQDSSAPSHSTAVSGYSKVVAEVWICSRQPRGLLIGPPPRSALDYCFVVLECDAQLGKACYLGRM